VPDDGRRTRLHDLLLGFGRPVQYSVFECELTARELARLRLQVITVLRPRQDALAVYPLCGSCRRRVELMGVSPAAGGIVIT
jgi:CRISPR-associated protein Cas2